MESLNKLKGMRENLVEQLQANAEGDNFNKGFHKKLEDSINGIDTQIAAAETARDYAAKMARPDRLSNNEHQEATYGFKNFGDWLRSVKNAGTTRQIDDRLTKAPAGANESDPASGGFAIPPMFFNTIITKVYDEGAIASEVFRIPVSDSNGISIPLIDEQSRAAGSRWGGVTSQWVSEGSTVSLTAPKYRLLDLKLNKLMSLWAVTDELMQDAPAVSAIAQRAFGLELQFMIEDSIIRGDGVGKPQGILNSAGHFKTLKDAGPQTADTVTYSNLANMYSHMWGPSLSNAKWFANQSIMPQLLQLQSGGSLAFPMWVAQGTADQAPKTMLFGKELKFVEQASGLGDEGDIMFLDLSQYVLIDKSAPQFASSIHVLFNSDQMSFRVTYRADGHSMWATTLAPAYGLNTMSPFVTLEAR